MVGNAALGGNAGIPAGAERLGDGPAPPAPARRGEPTRRRLLHLVAASPGIHVSQLCREAGLSWGTVQHHLRWLEQEGRIEAHRSGRLVRIFPASAGSQSVWLRVLREDIPNQILAGLEREPGSRIQDLSRSLGLSRKTIRRHLAHLLEAGLVQREGGYRGQFQSAGQR